MGLIRIYDTGQVYWIEKSEIYSEMTATRKIAKLLEILSMAGDTVSRADLMEKLKVSETHLKVLLGIAREEIGIFTITKPDGFIGYKINYEERLTHENNVNFS